jgi:hypothetical protein
MAVIGSVRLSWAGFQSDMEMIPVRRFFMRNVTKRENRYIGFYTGTQK